MSKANPKNDPRENKKPKKNLKTQKNYRRERQNLKKG
jgi:hypothetical protein